MRQRERTKCLWEKKEPTLTMTADGRLQRSNEMIVKGEDGQTLFRQVDNFCYTSSCSHSCHAFSSTPDWGSSRHTQRPTHIYL